MEWRAEQRAAIAHEGGSILVSAGAGSGKTAVLTERIAQLALGGVPLASMLVVTFTNAAAAEMKKRIEGKLIASDASIAQEQLAQLPLAHISTLHAFCIAVLRRHFEKAGVDAAFRVAEDTQSALLKEEAMDEAVETMLEDADFRALARGWSEFSLRAYALELYEFSRSQADPHGYLQRAVEMWGVDDFAELPGFAALLRGVGEALVGAVGMLEKARDLCPPSCKMRGTLDDELSRLRSAMMRFEQDPARAVEHLSGFAFARANWRYDAADETPWTAGNVERAKALRDKAKKAVQGLELASLLDTRAEAGRMNATQPLLCALQRFILLFEQLYAQKKLAQGIVDFSDLEHLALKVLDDEDVRREYAQMFTHVFVDEFQDTNAVQEALLSRLSRGDNLFLVGDVKQSIYRFRLADPTIFAERERAFRAGAGTTVALNANFRSTGNILEAVNDVFAPLLGEQYEGAALVCGRGAGDDAPVTLSVIERAAADAEDEEDATAIQLEAQHCAQVIRERMARPITAGGEQRMPRYGDFALLLRSPTGRAEVFARAFAAAGIPAYVEATGGFFAALEVQVFVNLLRLADNRRQDIPLASVMRALYGVEYMAEVRACDTEAALYDALLLHAQQDERSRELTELLRAAKHESRIQKLDHFLEWLLDASRLEDVIYALPGGERRMGNIMQLIAMAREYEAQQMRGLSGFIARLDKLQDYNISEAAQPYGDAVLISSIHRSKGLEYPVVLLAQTGGRFNLTDARRGLVMHKELGIGVFHYDDARRTRRNSLQRQAIAQQVARENLEEEMRILYVAMTRAREELHIVGTLGSLEGRLAALQGGQYGTLLDFVLGTVCDATNGDICTGLEGRWRLERLSPRELALADDVRTMTREEYAAWAQRAAAADMAGLEERFGFAYAYAPQPVAKLTVSGMAQAEGSEEAAFDPPSFLQSKGLTAAERGTALHAAMEHVDLGGDLSEAGLKAQVERMVAREQLTPTQAEAADCRILARFFASVLGMRMAASPKVLREQHFLLFVRPRDIDFEGEDYAPLQGVIDACFEEEDAWVLIDYKSDTVRDKTPQGYREAAAVHQKSLERYAYALHRLTGRAVSERYIFLLKYGEAVRLE